MCRGGDAERLLHESIGLVTISVDLVITKVSAVGRMIISIGRGAFVASSSSTAFSFHFAIGEKGPGDSACTPRFSVCPSSHAGFSLVPDKHTARADRRPFLLRESSLDPGQDIETACFKEEDGVCRRAHMSVVCFHTTATGCPPSRLCSFG